MEYREWNIGNGFEEKTIHFFVQMFSVSLRSLFYINFVLVRDILYGRILWHSMVIYGAKVIAFIKKSVKDF